ncbi:hypothetical protein SPRG_05954 [Saprolegnia parasitica CBS 223.65]|uniref:Secreted protein n=1 Tax=Saprolegnia parasitica (strain CBS 223.65) TaxID=695850 RepID=A0A067CRI0_SAPPC|nr:hypothetical protein SPRG_05954 [Saprolegnia parasitica CBS 223.65]KDO29417.1 hypothetical protein SPRG_05954 [Saprolegnia parasitica CBS 223.65]|eukprot:XP_012199919.1 hypothetical protein SPRG_05954 [Saprolegnia parasitica CBS 223.65]
MRLLALLRAVFPLLLALAAGCCGGAIEPSALSDLLSTDAAWACAMDALVALGEPLTPTDVAAVCASPPCVAFLRDMRPLFLTGSTTWSTDHSDDAVANLAVLVDACEDSASCSPEQDMLTQSLLAEVRNPHCDAAMEALGPRMTRESFCTLRPCIDALRAVAPRVPACNMSPTLTAYMSVLHACDAGNP